MTDAALLAAALRSPALTGAERRAAASMQQRLQAFVALTERQRAWVQDAAARAGVSVPAPGKTPRPAASAWDPEPKRRRR